MTNLSIIVPVYAGGPYLEKLTAEIDALRKLWTKEKAPIRVGEVIFVDDNAIDDSGTIIESLAEKHSWVKALHLSRNFGQHPATMAGILNSAGDWIVTLDEDLQHPPARIPQLLSAAVSNSADIVYGNPEGKVHQSIMRDFTSQNYKNMIERLTGNKHIRKVNSFRLIRGNVARAAASICGHDTYFDVALAWFSQNIETVQMPLKDDRYISTGKSGYNIRSLISHARRLAFSSQIKLLRLGTLFGILILCLSVFISLVMIALRLFAPQYVVAPGWTSLVLLICFMSGAILLLTGILLEYMTILVLRAHGKPLYFTIDRSGDSDLRDYFSNQTPRTSSPENSEAGSRQT